MSLIKSIGLSSVVLLTMLAGCSSADETSTAPNVDDGTVSAQDHGSELTPWANENGAHYHWTKEEHANRQAKAGARHQSNPNMTYHGGKVMTNVVSKAIFWGASWGTYSGDKITGIDSWYAGHPNSNYAKTVDEYTGTSGQVQPGGSHQGHIIDTSAAANGSNTATILAEVCKQVTAGNIVPDPGGNGYYPVYTDVKRGNAQFCAYHGSGLCNGVNVQYAFFFNLDGDAGCDPQDTSGLHSQGLAALANVTGHELSEARSDPSTISATGAAAWYDPQGSENGDKCAWTWGAPLVTFTNGTKWKVQGEWSNAAYTAGNGYANSSGQKGCLSGL